MLIAVRRMNQAALLTSECYDKQRLSAENGSCKGNANKDKDKGKGKSKCRGKGHKRGKGGSGQWRDSSSKDAYLDKNRNKDKHGSASDVDYSLCHHCGSPQHRSDECKARQ